MQQLFALWQSFDLRKRVILVAATLATFAAVLALANLAARPSMALLYAGLEPTRAGDVLAALDQRGTAYRIDGNAIYVDAALRDQMRMALAADGLPAETEAGYELLDHLSGFGTTAQMFDAAYWRAKEGELARTIAAMPQVRSARVHIAQDQGAGLRAGAAPKASVTLATAGGGLTPQQAKALRFLIASAVAGLSPDGVSVIDSQKGLIAGADDDGAADNADRAGALKRNVERLLEARVGYGKAVVALSLDTSTEREQITERTVDPDSRVAVSTDTEERSGSSKDQGGNAVTVASNLPQGGGAGQDRDAQSQTAESRERVNFEMSETTREVVRAPGDVRRVTVAVLVDGVQTKNDAGETAWTPRPDAELAALRDLVASAVGFDEKRGDAITIRSMPFEPVAGLPDDGAAAPGPFARLLAEPLKLVQLGVLAAVALVLGLFVLRPILAARGLPAPPRFPGLPAPGASAAASAGPGLTGEIDDGTFLPPEMAVVSGFGGGFALPGGGAAGAAGDDPVGRLKRMIAGRQDETVSVLRGWIEAPAQGRAS